MSLIARCDKTMMTLMIRSSCWNPTIKDDLFDLYVKVSADAVPEVDASKTYSELCTEKAKDDGYQHNAVKGRRSLH